MSRSPSESDSRRERRGTKARDDMSDDDDRKAKKSSARSDDDDDDRGKSRERPRESDRNEKVTKVLPIDKDDAAFVLGRGGATKRKIARVSGSEIDLDEHSLKITLSGTAKQTEAASDYIDYVSQQRVGPVNIKPDRSRNDFSAVKVPAECIGFVMGRNGQTLRSMEEEWGVLMFFAKIGGGREAERESLCIFGSLPSRRGAEVKVMSAIEHKNPGSCVSSKGELRDVERVEGDADVDGWSTDTVLLGEDNYSYALGARGSTRRKLAAASGCIIEYVGHLACFCGYKKDRRRGKDYLRWLIEQRTGNSVVEKPHDRDDCLVFKIPTSSIAFITGHRGETLRGIERESSTFCFTDGDRNTRSKEFEDLLIFS
ncbi:hypothetical protein M885DRAFT_531135 [Pelagophyceae sp. CCMP2097]|nr:hypothetical protein M885DRAFT_531135 [Pelagophyceae sp. CCMP2097]